MHHWKSLCHIEWPGDRCVINKNNCKEQMNKPKIKVIDAVMGTGKSTWLAHSILRDNKRTVIVLPILKELERYARLLQSIDGLVSLSDNNGQSKKERFVEALNDAQVILITHALFEKHLTFDTFDIIRDGGWSLVMDEVVAIFEPVKLVTSTDLAGLLTLGVLRKVPISSKVAQLEVNRKTLPWYLGSSAGDASANQKMMVREAMTKDALVITNDDDTMVCPTFSLNEERLNAFRDVTVLTYPFKGTDLDYWLQIKGYQADHMKLARIASNNSLDDFRLTEHDGKYSGRQFKDLIELVGTDQRGRQGIYGSKANHFSATEYKERLPSSSRKMKEQLHPIKLVIRREFRNSRHEPRYIEPEDFMFTCPSGHEGLWQDPQHGLPKSFIGESTWVPFNERATNDHDKKHNLAFLYNVFPFIEVEKIVQAFGLEYDQQQYALYVLIQWVWRSAIRKGEKVRLYLPSDRMKDILMTWLDAPME